MLFKATTTITTNTGGAATVYLGSNIRGYIVSLKYIPGTLATGADVTITGETSGIPILTAANAGTATKFFYPRAIASKVADGTAGTADDLMIPIFEERVKVVVAEGGNTTTGSIELIYCSE
jgi:hypothetical protein